MTLWRTSALVAAALAWLTGAGGGATESEPPQQAPSSQSSADAGTGVISGVVRVDDAGGAPVRRARVWIDDTRQELRHATITDDDGRFRFEGLEAGRFLLRAEKPGYVNTAAGSRTPGGPGVPLALADGQAIANADIRLVPGAVITGRVLDPRGGPAAGVSVAVSTRRVIDTDRALRQVKTLTTDDRGEYRFYGLPPGRYIVVATPPAALGGGIVASEAEMEWARRLGEPGRGGQTPPPGRPVVYAAVAYPGVAEIEMAAEIAIAAGEERAGIDLSLQLVPVASIAGVVVHPDGVPAANARVLMTPATAQTRTDVQGRFSFSNLQPRQYTLIAESAGASGTEFAFATATIAGEDVTGLSLTLAPGSTVSGRIAMDATPDASPPDPSRVTLLLRPRAGTTPRVVGLNVGSVAADGTFRFIDVAPGSYRLDVSVAPVTSGIGTWAVRSAEMNGQNLLDVPFAVEPGTAIDDVTVTLTNRVTELAGRLLDQADRPAPELFVIVFPIDAAHWRERSRWIREPAHPDSSGRFIFTGLPAGDYYLAVLPAVEGEEWHTPAFLEQVAPGALRVALADGARVTQDIRLAN